MANWAHVYAWAEYVSSTMKSASLMAARNSAAVANVWSSALSLSGRPPAQAGRRPTAAILGVAWQRPQLAIGHERQRERPMKGIHAAMGAALWPHGAACCRWVGLLCSQRAVSPCSVLYGPMAPGSAAPGASWMNCRLKPALDTTHFLDHAAKYVHATVGAEAASGRAWPARGTLERKN